MKLHEGGAVTQVVMVALGVTAVEIDCAVLPFAVLGRLRGGRYAGIALRATSNEQRATSNEQRATSDGEQAKGALTLILGDGVVRGEYPEIEPYEHGMLAVGDGNRLYWETCGNSSGKPALVLHGGPGSGCTPWHRRMFDPRAYRIVLFDQRNCGRSTPHASEPAIDLTSNTTQSLIADIEQLREHLGIDRWLVWGGSWGCTLALAYAECHPAHVTEMILWGVTNSRRREFDWLYSGWQQGGGLAALYPEQWARFRAVVPAADQNSDLAVAYARLLSDPDPEVHQRAAEEWCRWESAGIRPAPPSGLAEHFRDPRYALAFARIVTNCFAHAAWLEEGVLLRNLHRLAGIPAIMAQGERDLGAPLGTAWEMAQAWPRAELVIVENAGHDPSKSGMVDALIRAADHFARF